MLAAIVTGIGIYTKHQKTAAGMINSIAVLPFDMRSKDPDDDYFSDGITESINNSLARLPGLKVIPNSVALRYQGKSADFQKTGESLRVETVLSGRVVQRGGDLSIDIELNDVRDGKQLWGRRYNRKATELLIVQNDIAKKISQRLLSQLSADDRQKLTVGSTSNSEAYQLYLKGEYFSGKFTKECFDKGISYLNQAIALDPEFSRSYSALAMNYINQDDWFIAPKDSAPKARELAQKAIALDQTDSQAHLALAIENQWYEWDGPPRSESSSGLLSSIRITATQLVFTHRWDQAIEQLRYAIDLNLNYWFDYNFLGRAYDQKGRFQKPSKHLSVV